MEEIKGRGCGVKALNSKLKKQLDTLQNLLASVYNQLEPFQGTLGRGGGLDRRCENLVQSSHLTASKCQTFSCL